MNRQNASTCVAAALLAAVVFFPLSLSHAATPESQGSTPGVITGFVPASGASIFYKTMGTGDPIVVLHGGPGFDHRQFLPYIWELAKDHQVILFDQRGTGLSEGAVDSASINIGTFIADIEAIRSHFGLEKINLVGHSWGGLLAMYYALEHPDRLKSLVLCSATASIDAFHEMRANYMQLRTPEDEASLQEIGNSEAFNNGDPKAWEQFWRVWFRTYFPDRAQADRLDLFFPENTIRNCGAVGGFVMDSIGSFDLHDELSAISCPTLVMHGLADPMPATYAERIHAAIPGSELVLAPEVGHWFFVDGTEIFTSSILDFLVGLPELKD